MAGKDRQSARPDERAWSISPGRVLSAVLIVATGGLAFGQALYKYQTEDGSWAYTDRPPPGDQQAEVRNLATGNAPPEVLVTTTMSERKIRIVVSNEFHAPVEVILALDELRGVDLPPSDIAMRWTVPALSRSTLLELGTDDDVVYPSVDLRFLWVPGDPDSEPVATELYRAPFAVANDFPITQAYPVANTHNTPDSRHAVDIAMPIGTDIYAARAGIVFEVASTNYRGGVDIEEYAAAANLIRILHDDGTHAVYAHLNWNTIRVRPGDRVERGQYIADSGNTGFSSGPHLHFAVLKNMGMRLESVPVIFEGSNLTEIVPAAGNVLSAY